MATEYNRIIYNVKRPGPKAFLVSLPMYMYRIKTKKFEYGMDFFQKSLLMFKTRPGISNSTIAACLGLDEDLINEIQGVLAHSGYLTSDGVITELGLEKRKDMDSLVINKDKEELGYVFQFIDRDDYYPYYIKELGESPNLTSKNEIIIGTKGDGQDKSVMPLQLDFIKEKKMNLPAPNERVIFDLIGKSSKQGVNAEKLSIAQLGKKLSLSFLNEKPEPILVSVCTYIYLPQKDNDLYEPEWQILDPFGKGNNSQLKFYLESFNDNSFVKTLNDKFGGAETIDKKSFKEYASFLEHHVERIKEDDFGVEFLGLDKNLQQYLTSAIRNIFAFRQYQYKDFDSGDMFIICCQKALETIFLIDMQNRESVYEQMKSDYSTPSHGDCDVYYKKRRKFLKDITRNRIISMKQPDRLIVMAKNIEPNRAISLKHYIYNLILTYNYDNKSPLFRLINGKIEQMFDIAELRNKKGHGQIESVGETVVVNKDVAESTYNFIKEFINNYISIAL